MKLWLCLIVVLLCSALVMSQDRPGAPHASTPGPERPATSAPTSPTLVPTSSPPSVPTSVPTAAPPTSVPTAAPPSVPTSAPPTYVPTSVPPTSQPTRTPTRPPTGTPTTPTGTPTRPATDSDSSDSDMVVCMMMAIQCPNGTYSTTNDQCQFVCGASPIGGLSWTKVNNIRRDFVSAYGSSVVSNSQVGTLNDKLVKIQTPPESWNDYCIEIFLVPGAQVSLLPSVFNGVRVFYIDIPVCSPIICPDGTFVACGQPCTLEPEEDEESIVMFWPITIMCAVLLLSACCCCLRRRNRKCQQGKPCAGAAYAELSSMHVDGQAHGYPAEVYAALQKQEIATPEGAPILPPHMMQPMMQPMMYPPMPSMSPMSMPPMPVMPPHIMPNAGYVLMQAPNGMWYPVVPQSQQDA